MADPGPHYRKTVQGLFNRGLGDGAYDPDAGRLESITRGSVLSGILPGSNDRRYSDVFGDEEIGWAGKGTYVAGRLAHDFLGDGSRTTWWVANHPLGATSIAGEIASDAAGFRPDRAELEAIRSKLAADDLPASREAALEEWARLKGYSRDGETPGIPLAAAAAVLPLAASVAMTGASGTHDITNLAGGGRTEGYKAIFADETDPSVSTNPAAELGARYFFGRSGRLLDWEDFTQERPEVGPSDYENYRAFQFDKGPGDLGLFKATDRNLTGEPEFVMMGFQVPLTAASSAGGALVGGVAGAQGLDDLIRQRYAQRLADDPKSLGIARTTAGRRVAGAALGALAGSSSGNLGARAVNDIAIQPILNPEAVANQLAWEQQQQALGPL